MRHDGPLVRPPGRGRPAGPRSAAPWPGRRSRQEGRQAEKADRQAKAPKKQEKRAAKQEKAARTRRGGEAAAKRAEKTLRRRTPGTACRRCPSSVSWSTASTGSSANRRSWSRLRDLAATYGMSADEVEPAVHDQFRDYRATLQDDRRHLLERFEIVDMARKVVGVGSVGTRAFIVLLQGRDAQDPLFLQVKEATGVGAGGPPAQEPVPQPGERVVQGQRMMQAASDIYLGWTKGVQARPLLLLAATARHEGLRAGRHDGRRSGSTFYAGHLRVDPGPGPRPLRRPGRHRRLPRRRATRSTSRSPTSPSGTPTRTSRTTRQFVNAIRSGRLEAVEGV